MSLHERKDSKYKHTVAVKTVYKLHKGDCEIHKLCNRPLEVTEKTDEVLKIFSPTRHGIGKKHFFPQKGHTCGAGVEIECVCVEHTVPVGASENSCDDSVES